MSKYNAVCGHGRSAFNVESALELFLHVMSDTNHDQREIQTINQKLSTPWNFPNSFAFRSRPYISWNYLKCWIILLKLETLGVSEEAQWTQLDSFFQKHFNTVLRQPGAFLDSFPVDEREEKLTMEQLGKLRDSVIKLMPYTCHDIEVIK